jgi:hypothetical protein
MKGEYEKTSSELFACSRFHLPVILKCPSKEPRDFESYLCRFLTTKSKLRTVLFDPSWLLRRAVLVY